MTSPGAGAVELCVQGRGAIGASVELQATNWHGVIKDSQTQLYIMFSDLRVTVVPPP